MAKLGKVDSSVISLLCRPRGCIELLFLPMSRLARKLRQSLFKKPSQLKWCFGLSVALWYSVEDLGQVSS